ncbi:glucan biosynthesis protein [Lichenihabitans psoromatis]|uniref:glucan biosynthesis protein n=1 Tax=Lichenihabitans psoromatis TaxID=2528642 RepID=UPI001035C251|nr:glucan biosynthesis protein D [Lichenihabitans psoromatis]
MIIRRDVLKLAALSIGATASGALAQSTQPTPPATTAGSSTASSAPIPNFDAASIVDRARDLAKKPFVALDTDLPAPFAKLPYEKYVAIRPQPGSATWAGDNVGFALEPLHRGFLFSAPMEINVVENGKARRLGYDPSRFDFGGLQVPSTIPDIGFSGFRVLQPMGPDGFHEVAIFQGASFFRAIARGQNFGVTARALSIRTADPKGEEFPMVRAVWIERPTLANNALVLHALVDSESMTGAYRFTLRPGDITIIDTECTLFTRAIVDGVGLGTMAGMSFFGPANRRNRDDLREGVYETGGLQIHNTNGEWLWRPVSNRETLQISSFINNSPRGFGMLQRERRFAQFQDDDQHWELRPSLWIEPLSDWGEGNVVLVEIPSDAEINENIVCFWRPKAPLQANTEMALSYRQSWCWTPVERPPLAIVTETRQGKGASGKRRRFLVEFTGDIFADAKQVADLKPALSSSVGTIALLRTFVSQPNKTYRLLFELDPASENLSELRLALENNGKPVSETWLYRWTA